MNNIVLIGMPASGKSTTGVILAKILRYAFLDTDLLLQESTGRGLQEMIDTDGIEAFNALEESVVLSVRAERTVIATGGSVVYSERAMEHLRAGGKVVYLKLGCEQIERRLDNILTRRVVMSPGQTLRDVYDERISLYEKYADVTADADTDSIERTAENIIKQLGLAP